MSESVPRNIFVSFTTKLGPEYSISAASFSVSSSATDRTLDDVLNKMLEAAGKRTATFDFLVGGKLVRGELSAHQPASGGELKMQVEYILGIGTPREKSRASAPKVISKLALCPLTAIAPYLSACFDGAVEWRDASLQVARESDCYTLEDPLRRSMLCFDIAQTDSTLSVYAGGAWSELFCRHFSPETGDVCGEAQAAVDCSVVALATSPPGSRVWAGDCSGNLSAFSSDQLQLVAAARVADSTITALKSVDEEHLLVASRDDLMMCVDTSRLIPSATFTSRDSAITACESSARLSLVFSGHAAGAIRAFDLRRPDKVAQLFKAHSCLVSQVAFNVHTDHQFASACHGGLVFVWDLRSDRPLYEIDAANHLKIYSLLWADARQLLSGGEDQEVVAHDFQR